MSATQVFLEPLVIYHRYFILYIIITLTSNIAHVITTVLDLIFAFHKHVLFIISKIKIQPTLNSYRLNSFILL